MKVIAAQQKGEPLRWDLPEISTVLQLIFASLFIGLCAQIKIPLGFTPIPLTGQTFGVILVGSLLGRRKGALAALFYLIEGCLGLPVWAGGCSGFLHLMGPTGGYRLAYILQAYLVGWYVETHRPHFMKTAAALFLFCCLQLWIGTLWLGYFVGFSNVLIKGFYPFIPIEAAKVILVTTYWRLRK